MRPARLIRLLTFGDCLLFFTTLRFLLLVYCIQTVWDICSQYFPLNLVEIVVVITLLGFQY